MLSGLEMILTQEQASVAVSRLVALLSAIERIPLRRRYTIGSETSEWTLKCSLTLAMAVPSITLAATRTDCSASARRAANSRSAAIRSRSRCWLQCLLRVGVGPTGAATSVSFVLAVGRDRHSLTAVGASKVPRPPRPAGKRWGKNFTQRILISVQICDPYKLWVPCGGASSRLLIKHIAKKPP